MILSSFNQSSMRGGRNSSLSFREQDLHALQSCSIYVADAYEKLSILFHVFQDRAKLGTSCHRH